VDPAKVAELRRELLSILEGYLRNTDTRIVLRAIQSLGKALHGPQPIFNMAITQATLQKWEQEQLSILEALAKLVASSPAPVVLLEVIREVRHFARYGRLTAIKEGAGALIRSIGQSFEFLVTRILLPEALRWENLENDEENGGSVAAWEDRQRALVEPVVAELWRRFPATAQAVAELDRLVMELQAIAPDCSAATLAWWLLKIRPDASLEFAEELIRRPASPVIDCLDIALSYLRSSSPARAADIANRALDTGNLAIRKSVARFCRWQLRGEQQPLGGESELIERLLNDENVEVRRCGISALKWLGRFREREALDRALTLDLDGDPGTAAELCQFADANWGGIPDSFTSGDWTVFLRKFDAVREVDHHIADFLRVARKHVPGEVIEFILRRIRAAQNEPYGARCEPPHSTELAMIFEEGPAGPFELNLICDAAFANAASGLSDLAELFEAASHGFGEVGLNILNERLSSADEEQLLAGVALLEGAPNTFPFEHSEMILRILERGAEFGEECAVGVEDALVRITLSGVRHWIPGEPSAEDIEVRDRCRESLAQAPVGSNGAQLYKRILRAIEANIQESIDFELEH
jgi:hypothetical protein